MEEPALSIWLNRFPLILASRSEARLAMLRSVGIPVEVISSQIDERSAQQTLGIHATSREIGLHLAKLKAADVASRFPDRIVLGSDQTLEMAGTTFAKAVTLAEAKTRLLQMAGRTHELHSAYAIMWNAIIIASGVRTAKIALRPFSEDFLKAYLEASSQSVLGSVACYQVEGLGAQLIENIEGDWFTILGLPLWDVLADLRNHEHLLR